MQNITCLLKAKRPIISFYMLNYQSFILRSDRDSNSGIGFADYTLSRCEYCF